VGDRPDRADVAVAAALIIQGLTRERDEARAECVRYRERLQFDPGGSDKIDELEESSLHLRHRITELTQLLACERQERQDREAECAELVAERRQTTAAVRCKALEEAAKVAFAVKEQRRISSTEPGISGYAAADFMAEAACAAEIGEAICVLNSGKEEVPV
jgi:hypothetical protein